MRNALRIAFVAVALFALSNVLTAAYIAGLSLFDGAENWGTHIAWGWNLARPTLALLPLALLARMPRGIVTLSGLFLLLAIVQIFLPRLRATLPYASALHPANAMLLFGIIAALSWRTGQFLRAESSSKYTPILALGGMVLLLIGCTPTLPERPGAATVAPGNSAPTSAAAADTGQGNAERGRALFTTKRGEAMCANCHRTDSEQRLVGPGLKNVSARVSSYNLSQSVDDYLRNSILHPNDFVVPGYPASVMPENFGKVFSQQDINDLIAYLKSL